MSTMEHRLELINSKQVRILLLLCRLLYSPQLSLRCDRVVRWWKMMRRRRERARCALEQLLNPSNSAAFGSLKVADKQERLQEEQELGEESG